MKINLKLFNLSILIASSLFISSCSKSDKELIIGKWQSDQDWFVYNENNTYDAGKSVVPMVNGYKYSIDTKAKELSMYTDAEDQTYYLVYEFKGDDTLAVRNRLSSNTKWIYFHRVEK